MELWSEGNTEIREERPVPISVVDYEFYFVRLGIEPVRPPWETGDYAPEPFDMDDYNASKIALVSLFK